LAYDGGHSSDRYIFFSYADPDTCVREKTRGLLDKCAIAEVLQRSHVSFEADDAAALAPAAVAEKLLACGGAHKPNSYDFGGGLVVRKEWY
jgi:hypothetical protein